MSTKTTIILRNAHHNSEVRLRAENRGGYVLLSRRQYDRIAKELCGVRQCKHCSTRFRQFVGAHLIPEDVREIWARESDRYELCPIFVWERE